MSSPEEVLAALNGELYRYRIAVMDQHHRAETAKGAMLAERERREKDEGEFLVGPPMTEEALREWVAEMGARDIPHWARVKTEGQFLLVAVYGVLTMAKALRKATSGDVRSCVQRALTAFDKAAPDPDLLRHLHEHVDAYVRGEGRDAHRLPDPTQDGAIAMLDEGLVYFVGGKLFRLTEIANAADALAGEVAACIREELVAAAAQ